MVWKIWNWEKILLVHFGDWQAIFLYFLTLLLSSLFIFIFSVCFLSGRFNGLESALHIFLSEL